MIKVAIAGLGKMGLSHYAIINSHPDAHVAGICDSSGYVLSMLKRYTGIPTYTDYGQMLRELDLDAVILATPSSSHVRMARAALERGLHVFCEKPLALTSREASDLGALARTRGLVDQVGYHNRFVGAFHEVKKLLDAGAIGTVSHVLAEAYGPVVLRPKGGTWRSQRIEGGGSLYDYAAHPIDLLTWYLGRPHGIGGTALNSVFSRETDDEVFSSLFYPDGTSAQISVNWSDESQRKMSTRISIWGTAGWIHADRQECRAYLRATVPVPPTYNPGWNVRFTTELTDPVWFYLRGEEYSAQLDAFLGRIQDRPDDRACDFADAAVTDRVIEMMVADARRGPTTMFDEAADAAPVRSRRREAGARIQRIGSRMRALTRRQSSRRLTQGAP